MKHRNGIARSVRFATALAALATVAGSASAETSSYGPWREHAGACARGGEAPGSGYRDMAVRFEKLGDRGTHRIASQVGVAPGEGYRGIRERYTQPWGAPGSGYRDMAVRFDKMKGGATGKCPR